MKNLVLIALLANAFAAPALASETAPQLQADAITTPDPAERRSHRCPKRGAREGSTCGGV
jgi:hypothetical protein